VLAALLPPGEVVLVVFARFPALHQDEVELVIGAIAGWLAGQVVKGGGFGLIRLQTLLVPVSSISKT
jgi:hypothetical protein